jgi:hypothetical protein
MQTGCDSESESDDDYMDSVADPADLEERSRSSDRASPQTPLDTESGRGRAVSDGLGPTPDAGSVGARCRAHAPEQPGQTDVKEREVNPTDARFRHNTQMMFGIGCDVRLTVVKCSRRNRRWFRRINSALPILV